MAGNPEIAAFMAKNDQSVQPPRKSTFVSANRDGSEVWEDEESFVRVWPNGFMTEMPKDLPPGGSEDED
jgi:hypothetical protein